MKKIMITGMAFLIAMTALAGCGNVTETETTEETSAADGNQEISVSSGGNLTIPVDELTENAVFYPANVDGTEMEVIAVKTSDGTIRTAFNTCQICYDSGNGRTFILGRKYLSLERYFHKEIARVQSVWYAQQSERGIRYPGSSKHIQRLYRKKQNTVKDYLHKVTRWIAEYCRKEDIRCVVVGDIRNIRKEKDMGHKVNQKFHGLPYNRLYIMLGYKLKLYGIQLIKQEESYTSQCSPLSPEVSKRYAEATNRKERGMYITDRVSYNADAVGAFNILRKYLSVSGKQKELSVTGLKNPEIIKVAV